MKYVRPQTLDFHDLRGRTSIFHRSPTSNVSNWKQLVISNTDESLTLSRLRSRRDRWRLLRCCLSYRKKWFILLLFFYFSIFFFDKIFAHRSLSTLPRVHLDIKLKNSKETFSCFSMFSLSTESPRRHRIRSRCKMKCEAEPNKENLEAALLRATATRSSNWKLRLLRILRCFFFLRVSFFASS